jgi:hypothetical protein
VEKKGTKKKVDGLRSQNTVATDICSCLLAPHVKNIHVFVGEHAPDWPPSSCMQRSGQLHRCVSVSQNIHLSSATISRSLDVDFQALLDNEERCVRPEWLPWMSQLKPKLAQQPRDYLVDFQQGEVAPDAEMTASPKLVPAR